MSKTVSGEILKVNEELLKDPSLINQDSENTWLVKIELENTVMDMKKCNCFMQVECALQRFNPSPARNPSRKSQSKFLFSKGLNN